MIDDKHVCNYSSGTIDDDKLTISMSIIITSSNTRPRRWCVVTSHPAGLLPW